MRTWPKSKGALFKCVAGPYSTGSYDARIGAFIDDLCKILLVPYGASRQALQLDAIDSRSLSQALDFGGGAQNLGEQGALVSLGARGATRGVERNVSGNAVQDFTRLGGYVNVANNSSRETEAQMQSGNVGWPRLGEYWFSGDPWKAK
eukprot:1752210-Pyramimonas_sp.AAC.1